MLTVEGCQQRRRRLLDSLDPKPESDHLFLSDPMHLVYLANFWPDPISFSLGFPTYLILREDGHTKLLHDDRMAKHSVNMAHVDDVRLVPWYDGQSPGAGPRQLAVLKAANPTLKGVRIHDRPGDPYASTVIQTVAHMRRQKDADEVEALKACMRATEVGHAWARENVKAGMTELDVYAGIHAACIRQAGFATIVYGDFAVADGTKRRGGRATDQALHDGDMLILDFSVVLHGYRSDFTNTLVVGGQPNDEQQRLYRLCCEAMAAGEKELRAGASCLTVYGAVRDAFDKEGVDDAFPHHAGHGLGLSHPEAPFIVRHATETLLAGDVVTLEPGLYIDGVGGIRIEHNYLITDDGFERLSNHTIALS